jgi:GNAT superfamily N-acetyltransferase
VAAGTGVTVEALTGPALIAGLSEVARLRIEVFREWPYLYDGSLDYERNYLAELASARDAVIVAAKDGASVVGAATAAPLAGHTPQFAQLFAARGLDPRRVFYCGESVLLPAYRGRGIGQAFFDLREEHARACRSAGEPFTHVAFCAVMRAADDTRCPPAYRPLDDFWRARGYRPVEGLVGAYSWKEIGQAEETEKPMQFWMKPL